MLLPIDATSVTNLRLSLRGILAKRSELHPPRLFDHDGEEVKNEDRMRSIKRGVAHGVLQIFEGFAQPRRIGISALRAICQTAIQVRQNLRVSQHSRLPFDQTSH